LEESVISALFQMVDTFVHSLEMTVSVYTCWTFKPVYMVTYLGFLNFVSACLVLKGV